MNPRTRVAVQDGNVIYFLTVLQFVVAVLAALFLHTNWNRALWRNLTRGEDLMSAVVYAYGKWDIIGISPDPYPVLQGDPRAKLHGVYGGQGLEWSRMLE